MSNSLRKDKLVQLATKPKRAPPKAKYIDPLVQATFAQNGELQEIVRALAVRLQDDNTTVVFKSLIVLHTLMRSGSLDPTFSYLSTSALALSNHDAPNIAAYASYLAARIKSYANLKRDVIRDKSDRRAASRLRTLGVEQGLLREVREVQRMIASLVESKFYLDDIDDDVSMTALRLLVKDLLVLFSAVNEGVINVLEHYFEMSHTDATTALKIYKTFCRDTEKVVAYLGVAKKLHNVLNVQIPNLKHAPVSLVSSLEEYLNDPNFASNREEYKENKRIADGGAPAPAKPKAATTTSPTSTPSTMATTSPTTPARTQTSFTDFFASIEEAQTTMFNPSSDSPSTQYFQQQATFNPFLQQQRTGLPFQQPQFVQQQHTGYPAPNPFLQAQQTGLFQPQMQSPNAFLQSQPTGYLQPQANPFRQSMMATGGGMGGGSPFGQQLQAQPTGAFAPPQHTFSQSSPFGMQAQPTGAFTSSSSSPFGQPVQAQATGAPFGQQQASSPFGPPQHQAPQPTGSPFGQQPALQPLTQQKTGAKNPFNPSPGEVPTPKPYAGPSMNALASTAFAPSNGFAQQQPQQPFAPQQTGPALSNASGNGFGSAFATQPNARSPFGTSQPPAAQPLTQTKTGGLMASIASEFIGAQRSASPTSFVPTTTFSSSFSSSTSTAPYTSAFSSPNPNPTPLRAQSTGFGGSSVKPFQPTSSFGSKLADELGPTPLAAQPTGSTFNPFRASTLPPQQTGNGAFFSAAPPMPAPLANQPTGFVASSAFGQSLATENQQGQNGSFL